MASELLLGFSSSTHLSVSLYRLLVVELSWRQTDRQIDRQTDRHAHTAPIPKTKEAGNCGNLDSQLVGNSVPDQGKV